MTTDYKDLTEEKKKVVDAIRAVRKAQKGLAEIYSVKNLEKLYEVEEDLRNVYMKDINDNPLLSDTEKQYERIILDIITRWNS